MEKVAEQVASVVRYIPDPHARVPGSEWTFGETAAHIALGQRLMTELVKGVPSPFGDGTIPTATIVDEFASINHRLLAQFDERDGVRLADLINEATRSFCEEVRKRPPGDRVECHFGCLDLCTLASYALCHLLMHGYPLARALRHPFPITADDAVLTVPFLKAVLPFVSDAQTIRTLHGVLDIHIRDGPRFAVRYEEGRLSVEDGPPGGAHCHLSADPVAFFLVGTRLVNLWRPIRQGKFMAWGRRPRLALRFFGTCRIP